MFQKMNEHIIKIILSVSKHKLLDIVKNGKIDKIRLHQRWILCEINK